MRFGLAPIFMAFALSGCDWMFPNTDPVPTASETARDQARAKRFQAACGSRETYDRLKQVVFDEAIRQGVRDAANLDLLASHAEVRMEDPVVKSRDEAMDVTVCTGRFILELPPGAERGFGGDRRLAANIEYSAQAAADGSGFVYQIKGAEGMVRRLAAFDLKGQSYRPPVAAADPAAQSAHTELPDLPPPPARDAPPPPPAATPAPSTRAAAQPSFNCRYARSASEKMVCGSGELAALDREMSALFYAALESVGTAQRAELRRTRDRFLVNRERCDSEACVAQAYRDRMGEIRAIAGR